MKRIPRKLKKLIPKDTFYCYIPTSGMIYPKDGGLPYYNIKTCSFYQWMDGIDGYCKLVKCEVTDQCKGCGERLGLGRY